MSLQETQMNRTNRQWQIVERPLDREVRDSDFRLVDGEVREPGPGEVLVRTDFLGFDPAMKGWIENRANYAAPTTVGQVVPSRGAGEVLVSNTPSLQPGDRVYGMLGWQELATVPAAVIEKAEEPDLLSAHLGVLGSTGMTAFLGLKSIGRPFPGDVLVVTGAAGATGSVVCQLGKLAGCTVIGIAGGPGKCRWLMDELGVDAAIDYKAEDVGAALDKLAPRGVDVVWDNVGGDLLNTLLARIAMNARVVLCGGISRYSTADLPPGPQEYFRLVMQRATMSGFIVHDWKDQFPLARRRLSGWVREGRVKFREDVQVGLENAPRTLMRLFEGANVGKQILKVT